MDDLPFFFRSVLKALKENAEESLKKRKSDFYFHYTNLLAFQKIIEEKEIQFSNCKYLNDRSEIRHGKNLVKAIIEKEKLNPISSEKIEKLDRLLKLVTEFDIHVPSYSPNIYVFCLCENGDLLSQWKGYSKVGCPVAIKFEVKGFILEKILFFKVIYDEKRQKEIFEKAIKDFLAEDETSDTDKLITEYSFNLICGLAFFKNEKFQEEEEWRFVYLNIPKPDLSEDMHFRYKEKYLLPYVKFEFSKLFANSAFPFREIIVGPSRDELAMMSIKEFIDSHYPMSLDTKKIEINPSSIPLRSI